MKMEINNLKNYLENTDENGYGVLTEEDYIYDNAYENNNHVFMENRVYTTMAENVRHAHCDYDTDYKEKDVNRRTDCTNGILLKISDQLERIADALEREKDINEICSGVGITRRIIKGDKNE